MSFIALLAAVPIAWVVDSTRPRVNVFDAYHGETLALEATFQASGKPLELTGDALLCWQTNGMAEAWWQTKATISNNVVSATFTPAMDPGSADITAFLGVPGENWRAPFRLRFRSSPGATPNEVELPVKSLNFAQIDVLNAPWLLATNSYTKGEVDAKIAAATPADYATVKSNALSALQKESDPTISAWAKATTKPTYTAAEVGAVPTTRKVNGKALSSDVTLTASDVSAISSRFSNLNFIDTTNTFFSSSANPALGLLLDSYVNEVESDPTISAWAKAKTKPTYTAAEVGAVPTTRKVNGKALSADITLAAADVGAYAKTDTYAKSEVFTKNEATSNFYPKAEGDLWASWWSGDGFRVSVTNYNVAVTDSTAFSRLPTAAFDYKPDATNTAYTAVWNENTKWNRWRNDFQTYTNEVSSALANKADRAWGYYDSTTGLEAPEGYTWISSDHVAISAGLAYQKFITTSGAVWVLTSNGLSTEASGVASNAFFRVTDDTGNALFEIVKGDKTTVGADPDGITVDNTANPITVSISYPVTSTDHPTMQGTAELGTNLLWQTSSEANGAWTESWSGSSGGWTNTITMASPSPTKYFFRAYYQKGGDTYINNAAPMKLQKVILGGVTYTISVETINNKKLMVLTEE